MTIDAYWPERTVEELLQQLCDQADDQPLVATVCDDGWYTYRPRPVCHAGDVRWLCEEVLRLRQALVRPRKLVIFNGGSLDNKVGEVRVSDDQGTLEVPIENHAGRVTHTEQYRLLRTYLSPEGKHDGPYTVRLAEYWSTTSHHHPLTPPIPVSSVGPRKRDQPP